MTSFALTIAMLWTQLVAPAGGTLPQILQPTFKAGSAKAGAKTEITVSFDLTKGYAINRTPPIALKLTPVDGVTLEKKDILSSPDDPKSTDEYFVDLPKLKFTATAAKAGKFEIPGQLVYFFCSKSDGFCSRQVIPVKIPFTAQ